MSESSALPVAFVGNRLGLWPLTCLALTLFWDASGFDITVMSWLADPSGFVFRDHALLKLVLHDQARLMAWGLLAAVSLSALFPFGPLKRIPGRDRWVAITGILLALLAVGVMKMNSHTSCPWDLDVFGGTAAYVSHWAWLTGDGGPGRCFPGGHASAGFAFMALAWPWRQGQRASDRRLGRWILAASLATGVLFGAVQTIRGAHYPSHTLWTGLICWAVTWSWYRLAACLPPRRP
ncbi:MAG TPA: phosphatase PAP2 family protein [Hydrogenophaga sp.]|uniref:phosphatase PAP2 family protein n=1 Tax=Hydrogenophaga sp. TaxID=1904254 RepID=UPI002BEB5F9C|nr:phosphatase PAP2 family protein [Hydrogenophaga sp.]HMN94375.1 phosphatase PAP2 family protein [Hydrogenophaga sp.]HMP10855.1 phosphatase PAP2 family protein [Hydrogenophaga sp.]